MSAHNILVEIRDAGLFNAVQDDPESSSSASDLISVTAPTDLDAIRTAVLSGDLEAQTSADFYVSTSGSDSNPGTVAAPFATIAAAKSAVRARIASGLTAPVTILLRGGTYRLTATETFTVLDSGTKDYPITWKAYPGEEVTIKGSKTVSGTWATHSGSIMRLDMPGQAEFRTLWVNGTRAVRARTPNVGSYYLMEPFEGEVDEKDYFYFNPADKATGILPGEDVEVISYAGFIQDRHKFLSYDDVNSRLNVVTPPGPEHGFNYRADFGRYYLENSLSFLTEPGEFYFDPELDRLYYWPRTGEDMATATVEVPVVDRLLDVSGNESAVDFSGDYAVFLRFKADDAQLDPNVFKEVYMFATPRTENGNDGIRIGLRKHEPGGVGTGWVQGYPMLSYLGSSGDRNMSLTAEAGLDDNAWHSICLKVSPTENVIDHWVDGVNSALAATTVSGTIPNTPPRLGTLGSGSLFKGSIADIQIIDGIIDNDDAAALHAGTYVGTRRATWSLDGHWDTEGRDAALIHGGRVINIGTGATFRSTPTFGEGWTTGKRAGVFDGVGDVVDYALRRGVPAKHIKFQGLKFHHTDWVDLEGNDSDYGDLLREGVGASIKILYAEDIEISDCTVSEVPTNGIWVDLSARVKLLRNTVHDTGYCGIALQGADNAVSVGNYGGHIVEWNKIYNYGWHLRSGHGIYGYFLANCKVNYNYVHDGSYCGIRNYCTLNSRWNSAGNNEIAYNHVHDVMRELYDGAGIMGSGRQDNTHVHHNRIHHCVQTELHTGPTGNIRGIYFDQGSHGVTIENNLIYDIYSSNLFFHQANYCTARNNILVDTEREGYANIDVVARNANEIGDGTTTVYNDGLVIEKNICYQRKSSQANYRLGTPNDAWLGLNMANPPWTQDKNLFNTGIILKALDASTTEQDITYLQGFSMDDNSIIDDPLFVDYMNEDFRIVGSSPALTLGFVPFEVPDLR